jgi:NAD(P)-dependent dehydrogenase (short-subunit alcohol dehydrogenase family)
MNATKVAIITGAGSGIGSGCAREFVTQGWNVGLNFIDPTMKTTVEDIKALAESKGLRALLLQGDVSKDADCRAMAQQVQAGLGRIDALINCAGVTKFVAIDNLDGLDAEDFQRIYAVNTVGAFLMSRACRDALVASGDGAIINVSSLASLTGGGSSLAYAASKGALNTLTMSLARAMAPKVRVNAICPALIAEGFVQRLAPDAYEKRGAAQIARAPLQRVGTPEEVARTIHAIVTAMPLTTGEIISLDLGFHLNADS